MRRIVQFFIVVAALAVGIVAVAQAQPETPPAQTSKKCDPGIVCLENPLANETTEVPAIIGTIIKAALGIIGSLTLIMFVWGGFLWFTAAGNDERIKQGAETMLWAAIGVIIVFSSYLLLTTF